MFFERSETTVIVIGEQKRNNASLAIHEQKSKAIKLLRNIRKMKIAYLG